MPPFTPFLFEFALLMFETRLNLRYVSTKTHLKLRHVSMGYKLMVCPKR